MKPKNIELHIEELVLNGFEGIDRRILGKTVEHELSRLFAEQGIPPSLEERGRIDNLDAGEFEIPPDSRPEMVGAKIAQAVYGGFKK